jgi:glucokinase
MSAPVVAVDLGGTKLATAVVSPAGEVVAQLRAPVESASPAATADQITAQAEACVRSAGLNWSGVGGVGAIVPGIYDPGRDAAWAPNLWGDRDVALGAVLRARIPVPVRIDSDRSGYVLGEQWLGVAKGLSDVVFVAVGTGIGVGILAGGRVLRGAGGIAGAAGWFALNPDYQDRYRGCGCWEAEAAGPGVARRAGAASAEAAVEAARRGEPRAAEAVAHAARYLAMGIANLISAFNPQLVALGGGLMHAGDLFLEPIRCEAPRWAQPRAARQARIELSTLGAFAGLAGAARLALSPGETFD